MTNDLAEARTAVADARTALQAHTASQDTSDAALVEAARTFVAAADRLAFISLPGWDDMSDIDKGAALMHLHKRENEGNDYAVENYPCRYLDDPRLKELDGETASEHAAQFEDKAEALSGEEHERLYELAQDAGRRVA